MMGQADASIIVPQNTIWQTENSETFGDDIGINSSQKGF